MNRYAPNPLVGRTVPLGCHWSYPTSVPSASPDGTGRVRPVAPEGTSSAIRGLLVMAFLLATASLARGQDSPASIVQKVGIDQNLGAQLPLDARLKDESGRSVRLGEFFHPGKPVILAFVYYKCPMLCSKELDSLNRSMRVMTINVGPDYEVVTVSISPDETPALASAKKASYLRALDRPGGEAGWHFLTGDAATIAALTDVAGFRYVFNPKTGLYAHDAGLIIATPDGRIAKYLPGLDYPAKGLQAAIKASSAGAIGRAAIWIKLLCYDYDPATGKYSLAIMRTVQAGGILTVAAMAVSIVMMNRAARRRAFVAA
jgi:protein SCO1